MTDYESLVTVSEAADLLSALWHGRDRKAPATEAGLRAMCEAVALGRIRRFITPRQVRYLGLESARRGAGLNGGRLYGTVDVAVVALFGRLSELYREWELPAWRARAVLLFLEDELRAAMGSSRRRFLVVDQARGTARVVSHPDRAAGGFDITLRPLFLEVQRGMTLYRRAFPEIWNGSAYVDGRDIAEVTV